MRATLKPLVVLMSGLVVGCASVQPNSGPAGVAPDGVYAFTGRVDGEVVTGTIDFGDPVLLEGSHGRCIREVSDLQRWAGPFGVSCPGFAVRVRIDENGMLQDRGFARLARPAYRRERTTCKVYSTQSKGCVQWNTAPVQYDRWVQGRIEIKRLTDTVGY